MSNSDMEDIDGALMSDNDETPLPASSSPAEESEADGFEDSSPIKTITKKRGAEAMSGGEGDEEGAKATAKKAKSSRKSAGPPCRQRKAPAKAARAIPRAPDECDAADAMLVKWRDEGKLWPAIRAEYTRITGEKSGTSTLPNRYIRLKINFANIKEEDNAKLLQSKIEVDAAFEKEKWDAIAQGIVDKGGDTYIAEVIHYQYKKIMLNAGVAPPNGITDQDFEFDVEKQYPVKGA